jgi:CHAD domain-containing protein
VRIRSRCFPQLWKVSVYDAQVTRTDELLRAFFREQYARMLAHDAGVRSGDDPEDLHQLRVAVRRMRSIIRTAKPALDEKGAETLQDELLWLAGETSQARDLDVLLPVLRDEADALEGDDREALRPVLGNIAVAQMVAGERAQEAVSSERYRSLLAMVELAADSLPQNGNGSLEGAAHKEFKRLKKAMKHVADDPTDEAIHKARIKGKRARYAAELLEAELGKSGKDLIAATKRFQDVAGEHHDTVVAEEQVRTALRGMRAQRTLLAAGLLVAAERERRRLAAADLPGAWKKVDKAADKVWS